MSANTPPRTPAPPGALWVLSHPITSTVNAATSVTGAAAGAAAQIDPNVFRDALHAFAATLNNAMIGLPWNAGNYELDEVMFQANFSADVGFILVGGVAAQGAIVFRYARNPNSVPIG